MSRPHDVDHTGDCIPQCWCKTGEDGYRDDMVERLLHLKQEQAERLHPNAPELNTPEQNAALRIAGLVERLRDCLGHYGAGIEKLIEEAADALEQMQKKCDHFYKLQQDYSNLLSYTEARNTKLMRCLSGTDAEKLLHRAEKAEADLSLHKRLFDNWHTKAAEERQRAEKAETHIGTWQHHYELERQRAERAEGKAAADADTIGGLVIEREEYKQRAERAEADLADKQITIEYLEGVCDDTWLIEAEERAEKAEAEVERLKDLARCFEKGEKEEYQAEIERLEKIAEQWVARGAEIEKLTERAEKAEASLKTAQAAIEMLKKTGLDERDELMGLYMDAFHRAERAERLLEHDTAILNKGAHVQAEIEKLKTHIGTWQHHYELERQRAERAEAENDKLWLSNREYADEIERLREALEKIAADEDCHVDHKRFLARAALKPTFKTKKVNV